VGKTVRALAAQEGIGLVVVPVERQDLGPAEQVADIQGNRVLVTLA
jgi:hypothetical protein